MKIIVDIDENLYIKTQSDKYVIYDKMYHAIKNGTPLPKGHGRLIDAEVMKTMKSIQSANFNAVELIRVWIDKQPTIIEADKEVENNEQST